MKLTPLYNVHLSLGAKMFTTAAGYQMPAYYSKIVEEHRSVRERVGMLDLSLMGRIDVKGKQSFELIQQLSVNDANSLADGQAMYTTFCNKFGNIVDDVTVWRFDEEHFRVVTSSVMRQRSLRWIQQNANGMNAYVTDISSSLRCISIQGTRTRDKLRKLCDTDLNKLRFFRFGSTKLAGIPCIIARIGFTGELGFECYFGAEDTVEAWNAIAQGGREFEILPYGLDVLDTLRYEKGFIFFGYEITEENNPFECGLDRWIKFDKPVFLGKQSLLSMRKNGAKQKLVGLETNSLDGIKQPSDVRSGDKKIGKTLLAFYGLTVGKNIVWAFVDAESVRYGNRVAIASKAQETNATMINIRCYDPSGKRMKM